MTKVLITYHMIGRDNSEDETAIILPMTNDNAVNLIVQQDRSKLVRTSSYGRGMLATTLDRLAKLQGYAYGMFITAERIY